MTRDPRTNPQKGDVLRKWVSSRGGMYSFLKEFRKRSVIRRDGLDVIYQDSKHKKEKNVCLATWKSWARDAEVVTGEG